MSEPRLRRNKNKGAYRLLFFLFVICLVVYFWLFVAQSLDQDGVTKSFCFIFLIGGSVVLTNRMQQEPDFEIDPIGSEKTKKLESNEDLD